MWHRAQMAVRFLPFASFLCLASCSGSAPDAVELPGVKQASYRVLVRTYQDGAYADQPFHILVKQMNSGEEPKTVLRSEQCKNVSVAQDIDTVYVFYEELTLAGFTGIEFGRWEPVVQLCDLHAPICRNARRELARTGAKFSDVCSYRTGTGF